MTRLILFASTILLFVSLATAQDNSSSDKSTKTQKKKEVIKYKLKQAFWTNVVHNYRMTETTKVKRVYQDSTVYEYERDYTFYFTLRARGGYDDDGLQNINVAIDSIEYAFKDQDNDIHFNSGVNSKVSFHIDALKTVAISAMDFEAYFTKYLDYSKFTGGILQQNKTFMTNPNTRPRKEFVRDMWETRYSDETIKHLIDVGKTVLPSMLVARDSTWVSELRLDINQANFKTYVQSKLTELKGKYYLIESKIDSMNLSKDKYRLEDLKKYAKIDSSNVTGSMTYRLDYKGQISYVEADVKAKLYGEVSKFKFTEDIQQNTIWDLLQLYNY